MTTQHDAPAEPVAPDVDVHMSAQRRRRSWDPGVLAAIAAGGVLGAEARYGMSVLISDQPGQWPWATWLVNISGCLLIGILMVAITELTSPHRLVRPFLGVGILGGYTTFSSYTFEGLELLREGEWLAALWYALGSNLLGLAATYLGMVLARAIGR